MGKLHLTRFGISTPLGVLPLKFFPLESVKPTFVWFFELGQVSGSPWHVRT